MRRGRIAWIIAIVDLVVYLVSSLHPLDGGVAAVMLYTVGLASFTMVGALLCTRVPENPIGVLLLAVGTVLVAAIASGTYSDVGKVQVPPWPGWELARIVGDVTFIYPFVIAFIGVPLVFPDGRLLSPRFRWVARIAVADMVVWTLLGVLFAKGSTPRVPGLAFLSPVADVLQAFVLIATLVSFGGAVVAVGLRFRRGDAVQRQQVKWLAADVAIAAILLPLSLMLTDASPELANTLSGFAVIAMFALPVVIAIAVLRYRLYEIDRIISRSIGWAIVTGVLVAVFAGGVVLLQAALAPFTNENTLAVAGSTLVAFALFQPLRRRVQRTVDRRFDRARYDGEQTVQAFAEQVRNDVDLASLQASLAATADRAVRPAGSRVWLSTRGIR